MKKLFLLLISLVLVSCGGGGGGAPSLTTPSDDVQDKLLVLSGAVGYLATFNAFYSMYYPFQKSAQQIIAGSTSENDVSYSEDEWDEGASLSGTFDFTSNQEGGSISYPLELDGADTSQSMVLSNLTFEDSYLINSTDYFPTYTTEDEGVIGTVDTFSIGMSDGSPTFSEWSCENNMASSESVEISSSSETDTIEGSVSFEGETAVSFNHVSSVATLSFEASSETTIIYEGVTYTCSNVGGVLEVTLGGGDPVFTVNSDLSCVY